VERFSRLSRCVAAAFVLAAPVVSASSAHILAAPGCEGAERLPDGSWEVKSNKTFGLAGDFGAGAIVWRGTIINGVDLGALLEKTCFRRYRVEPDYPPYLWAPNGYPSWVTPTP
jgi:hypothetical protein